MKQVIRITAFLAVLLIAIPVLAELPLTFADRQMSPIKSWWAQRAVLVVKQETDYSCAAASLATILTHYYAVPTTEASVLKNLPTAETDTKTGFSFAQLAIAAGKLGFKAQGFATDISTLRTAKIPLILYLEEQRDGRRDGHFTVLKTIKDDVVYLADPAWGNRTLSIAEFRARWEVRADGAHPGKLLAITPISISTNKNEEFLKPSVNPDRMETVKRDRRSGILADTLKF